LQILSENRNVLGTAVLKYLSSNYFLESNSEFLVEDCVQNWIDGRIAISQPLVERIQPNWIGAQLKEGFKNRN
jgi:hypothetical protein